MAATSFKSTLLEKIPRSSDTTSYRFSRPADYTFKAGQWYTITIPSPDGPLDHHFSHADSPTESHVELTTRLTGSVFKNTLDALPIGAEVDIQGAYGAFLFGYDKPKIAFLTGGIGVTPVRSMLRYLADTGGAGRVAGQELAVFYGSMTEDGIVYKDEFDEFERKISGLRVVHVITNPTPEWKGYGGLHHRGHHPRGTHRSLRVDLLRRRPAPDDHRHGQGPRTARDPPGPDRGGEFRRVHLLASLTRLGVREGIAA